MSIRRCRSRPLTTGGAGFETRFGREETRPRPRQRRRRRRTLNWCSRIGSSATKPETDQREIQRKSITKDVLPYWRGRDITTISRRDCLDRIDALVDRGHPVGARRLHARLHRLFQWALGRGIVTVNPLAGVEKAGNEEPRERALADDELVKVWGAAEEMGYPYGKAFQLLILTGTRRDEIGCLRWSEVNGGIVKLPGARTKNKEPHVVPLSAPARAILELLPRIEGSDFVFTMTGRRGLSAWSREKARLDKLAPIAPWRTHDLGAPSPPASRSSACSWW